MRLSRAFEGIVPPHFYGVMAKTELGCEVLQEKGHFAEFAHFIRRHGLESEDSEVILKLKSVLWAVVSVCTHRTVTASDDASGQHRCYGARAAVPRRGRDHPSHSGDCRAVAGAICARVRVSPGASHGCRLSVLRRTCFFVLGLISSTPQGAEILDDYHWEATLSPLGLPTGLCVPVDVDKFVSVCQASCDCLGRTTLTHKCQIPHWDCVASEAVDDSRLAPPESDEEMEVMTAIYNLANTVIANAASRSLTKYAIS